jgi:hypothetical protein
MENQINVGDQNTQQIVHAKRPTSLSVVLIFWFLMVVFGFLLFLYLLIGTLIGTIPSQRPLSITIGFSIVVLVITFYLGKVCADLWRGKKSGLTPIKIFSVLNLLNFPAGLILSVSTFMVLKRPDVRAYFGINNPTSGQPSPQTTT